MKKMILGILILLFVTGCTATTTARLRLPALQTVPQVDLERYLGTWYDIASFPQKFQRGCTASTAIYTKRPDGEIDVLNSCRQGSLDGKEISAKGRARVVDHATNSKLKVSFFRPFWGDYWIIDLGQHYEYAVVGHPSRDYLWILSRTPELDSTVYDRILARLRVQGYEVERLNRTLQPARIEKGPILKD
jgi:apolipoprotein D and lipocalin family protein